VAPFEYSVIGNSGFRGLKCGLYAVAPSSICAERNSGPVSERAQLAHLIETAQICRLHTHAPQMQPVPSDVDGCPRRFDYCLRSLRSWT
jgi:hypothetical protein